MRQLAVAVFVVSTDILDVDPFEGKAICSNFS
jgi:hypothetical protein